MPFRIGKLAPAILLALAPAAPALAQTGNLELELNTAADVAEGCRLTYVVTNSTDAALDQTAYEVAAFDASGTVSTIFVLDFGALPQGKTRVVQFDLPGAPCTSVSRLLVNGAEQCAGGGGAKLDICMKSLVASSRLPEINFGI